MIISLTSSTDINLRTVLLCVSREPRLLGADLRVGAVGRGSLLAADPDYPSEAVIRQLMRQILAAMILNGPDADPENRQN